jgi:hypothetical protein
MKKLIFTFMFISIALYAKEYHVAKSGNKINGRQWKSLS